MGETVLPHFSSLLVLLVSWVCFVSLLADLHQSSFGIGIYYHSHKSTTSLASFAPFPESHTIKHSFQHHYRVS